MLSMILVLSIVLGILPLLGVVWTVMDGMITTVDGLFMSLILLTLSGVFMLNAYWEMRDMGLIRGASLDNAICFDRETVQNPEGLRFADECCRHKALDLIGDLALIGKPLLGHVIAERAGHAMHAALVARIMSDPTLYEILSFDQLPTRAAHALVS